MNIEFRPILSWPGTPTRHRKTLLGQQTYPVIIARLKSEMEKLKTFSVIVCTGHQADDIRRDGMPKASARVPLHPGVIVWFDSRALRGGKELGSLRYACDTYDHWQDNLRAIVLTLEALRAVDRHGATLRGEQYRGFTAIPSKDEPPKQEAPKSQDIDQTSKRLRTLATIVINGMGRGCIPSDVDDFLLNPEWRKTVYRKGVLRLHPDQGGDETSFRVFQTAWDEINAAITERQS